MQTLLSLDDYGYESSDAGEAIRSCKSDQRGYDITNHSGMDVMRFYKRLLERYKGALKTEVSRLNSEKSDVDRKCVKKSDQEKGWKVGTMGVGSVALIGASMVLPVAPLIGLGFAIGAAGGAASGKAGSEKRELRERSDEYQSRIDKARQHIGEIEGIESKYKLSQV